ALATAPGLPERALRGTAADGREAALLQAADELHTDRCVTDATWTELTGFLTPRQLIELLTAVGAFRMLATTATTLDGRI
ncbi:carboxymuconolactone decarboxylase family protein, partial [Actinocorallia lasiicapitis]